MKHNNVIQNQHFKKHGAGGGWQARVKVTLDQPAKKLKRRQARKARAEKMAPRPVDGLLRPTVRCPTQRYNTKLRLGRGFTLEELKKAGINKKVARSIGVAVDHRRRNKSEESLATNVERLKAYKARLVVFPRKAGKIKAGDASVEETKAASQLAGPIMPVEQRPTPLEFMAVTEEMKTKSVVRDMKMASARQYLEGKKRWIKEDDDEKKK